MVIFKKSLLNTEEIILSHNTNDNSESHR